MYAALVKTIFVFAVWQQKREEKQKAELSLQKSVETTEVFSLQIKKLQRDVKTEQVSYNLFFVIMEAITDSK